MKFEYLIDYNTPLYLTLAPITSLLVEPGFYSKNLLMIGKTMKCLKRKEEAISYLMKVYKINVVTEDDKAVSNL